VFVSVLHCLTGHDVHLLLIQIYFSNQTETVGSQLKQAANSILQTWRAYEQNQ